MDVERLKWEQPLSHTDADSHTAELFSSRWAEPASLWLDTPIPQERSVAEKKQTFLQQKSSTYHYTPHCSLCSNVTAAEEGRDQCPTPEHSVPWSPIKRLSVCARSRLGKDSSCRWKDSGCQWSSNSLPADNALEWQSLICVKWLTLGIYSQWQSVFKK